MPRILWLDDRFIEVGKGIAALESAGYEVIYCPSENHALEALGKTPAPDLIIQDIHRPTKARRSRASDVPAHQAGWRFYADVLRTNFPQLPVLVCSYDAHVPGNLRQADDFNLILVEKTAFRRGRFESLIQGILASRHTLHARERVVPEIISVDFDTVNAALIRHLSKHPQDLHAISWSKFESLVERLLRELGYEVLHTPLTRDGGVDIWALQRTGLGDILYAIDAKKYAPTQLVGPEPVRAIYGVADLAGASAGMIVTTTRFGPAALSLASQYRYRIALKDFEGVVDWIRTVAQH
jgi:CheY-like chemotaxis protein